jgi:very-short-patch-repair endonuclease
MNSAELIERARELRKNPTTAEAALWEHLRNGQLDGLKFRRQHPVCGYILDFYCKKARLGIELDGGVHLDPEQKDLDRERTRELEDAGVMILRFWNSEVMQSMSDLLDKIKKSIDERMK